MFFDIPNKAIERLQFRPGSSSPAMDSQVKMVEMEVTHHRESDPQSRPKRNQRPHESSIALLPTEITALGIVASLENENFISAKSGNVKRPKPNEENERNMIGQLVHGVVDGVFDAGYLLSVRIGNSDTIFRGVVFRPGMTIPPSKMKTVVLSADGEHAPRYSKAAGENQSVNVVPSPESQNSVEAG